MVVDSVLAIAKAIGPPGSTGFFLLVLAAAAVLLRSARRLRRVGVLLLAAVCIVYVVLSLPVVARAIAGALPAAATHAANTGHVDVLMVLDGDNRDGRVVESMRAFRTAAPRQIWVLGADALGDDLATAGVPRDRLMIDPTPANTREQIARVGAVVADHPTASVAVVASQIQMPRVAALTAAARLHVRLLASPVDHAARASGPWRWLPALSALDVSRDALYEHAALAYYGWRGWIARNRS